MVGAEPTQVYQVFIRATPEQVWDAITRPEFTEKYFYGTRVETTAKAGTPLRYHSPDGSGKNGLWGDDVVIESDPPRRLVATWHALWDPVMAEEPGSRVTWEIEPQVGGICKLTVIHDQLERSPKTAAAMSGWTFVLSGLKTVVETGKPLKE